MRAWRRASAGSMPRERFSSMWSWRWESSSAERSRSRAERRKRAAKRESKARRGFIGRSVDASGQWHFVGKSVNSGQHTTTTAKSEYIAPNTRANRKNNCRTIDASGVGREEAGATEYIAPKAGANRENNCSVTDCSTDMRWSTFHSYLRATIGSTRMAR